MLNHNEGLKNDFRIIVIDDNIDIHKDFINILTSNSESQLEQLANQLFDTREKKESLILPQFKIDTAIQGKNGVEQIAEAIKEGNPYALAFVDIRMPPGWDGIETIKHIWELDKNIQIVICTAFSDHTQEETIAHLGQNDNLLILKKPFDHVTVRQLACALTRKWKLMQETSQYARSLEKIIEDRTAELQFQATHDSLTGLPNRVLLLDRLQQAVENGKRNNKSFAVLFLDLDRFKLINDSLGHSAGDELLAAATKRLRSVIRSFDTLARLGGDEFVIIANDLFQQSNVNIMAEAVLNAIKQPYNIRGHDLTITTSIGISIYPQDGQTPDVLLQNADSAMYYAKKCGCDQFQLYVAQMNEKFILQLDAESQLQHALENNELCLWYQPEYDIKTDSVDTVEALIRWNHPMKGLLLPIDFIPFAEETGLIVPIGEWVMREACRQNKAWQNAGLPFVRVAVNLSAQQLQQFNLIEMIQNILKETKLESKYFEIELSENCIINNASVFRMLHQMKALGIKISIDDFGTSYNSLSYLRYLPLDRLKIDRSFVQNIESSSGDEIIIRAIIAMAQSLNLDILAEGVETKHQLEFLKKQECKEIQGYYFSQPLPADQISHFLKDPVSLKKWLEQSC
jgi:diguanylate cyclase (GGDEF)-like protein